VRTEYEREVVVLEPESPEIGRSKLSRNEFSRTVNQSSSIFVPQTLGSPDSMGGAIAEELPKRRTRLNEKTRRTSPPANASQHDAKSIDQDSVNVHSKGQEANSDKENEDKGWSGDLGKDALQELREWLGDCVEFE
jgi:hypothetical protein